MHLRVAPLVLIAVAIAVAASFRAEPVAADWDMPASYNLREMIALSKRIEGRLANSDQKVMVLSRLSQMQYHAHLAKDMEVGPTNEVPPSERATYTRDYRLKMIALLEQLLATEKALLTDDHTAAEKHFAKAKASSDSLEPLAMLNAFDKE